MKTILYLGTDPHRFLLTRSSCKLIHYPVIAIIPRSIALPPLDQYTHFIFTSKNGVRIFFDYLDQSLTNKTFIAIGRSTAHMLEKLFRAPDHIADQETQEGIIELLKTLELTDAHFFLPRSSLSRPALSIFFEENRIRFTALDLYDTVVQKLTPVPDLSTIDEIVFTSPSTVRAFIQIFGPLPQDKILHPIGPITAQALKKT